MDFYLTLAALAGHDTGRLEKHDGVNLLPVWRGEKYAKSPREFFFYFKMAELQAVRSGKWKLRHAFDAGKTTNPERLELYDLSTDPAESRDVAGQHPEIVKRLVAAMDAIRKELGDSRLGIQGTERREPAISKNPKRLTTEDKNHPYIEPVYQLGESG
jgi:arylsulfatase